MSDAPRLRRPVLAAPKLDITRREQELAGDKENGSATENHSIPADVKTVIPSLLPRPEVKSKKVPLRSLTNHIRLRPNAIIHKKIDHVKVEFVPESKSHDVKPDVVQPKLTINSLADKFDKAQVEPRKKIIFDGADTDGQDKYPLSEKQKAFLVQLRQLVDNKHFHTADDLMRNAIRSDWPKWTDLRKLYERTRRQALATRTGIFNILGYISQDELDSMISSPCRLIEIEMLLRGKRPLEDEDLSSAEPAIQRHKSAPQLGAQPNMAKADNGGIWNHRAPHQQNEPSAKRLKANPPQVQTTPKARPDSITAGVLKKLRQIRRNVGKSIPPASSSKSGLMLLKSRNASFPVTDDVLQAMSSLKITEPYNGESRRELVQKHIGFFNLPHGFK